MEGCVCVLCVGVTGVLVRVGERVWPSGLLRLRPEEPDESKPGCPGGKNVYLAMSALHAGGEGGESDKESYRKQ